MTGLRMIEAWLASRGDTRTVRIWHRHRGKTRQEWCDVHRTIQSSTLCQLLDAKCLPSTADTLHHRRVTDLAIIETLRMYAGCRGGSARLCALSNESTLAKLGERSPGQCKPATLHDGDACGVAATDEMVPSDSCQFSACR
jgi:hypothetical protein